MIQADIDTLKEASRNFGAEQITRYYLESGKFDMQAMAQIRRLHDEFFKKKGLGAGR